MKTSSALLLSLLLFVASCASVVKPKEEMVQDLLTISKTDYREMIKTIDQRFAEEKAKLAADNEDEEVISNLSTIMTQFKEKSDLNFKEAILREEQELNEFSQKELADLTRYLHKYRAQNANRKKIENLPAKVSDFFATGEDKKIPPAKKTLIDQHFTESKMPSFIALSVNANAPLLRELMKRQKKSDAETKAFISQQYDQDFQKSTQVYTYLANLESEKELKEDIAFFRSKTYARYVTNYYNKLKLRSESSAKFMLDMIKEIHKALDTKPKKVKKG